MVATTKSKILNKSWQSLLLSGLICTLLSACGGGGSDSATSQSAAQATATAGTTSSATTTEASNDSVSANQTMPLSDVLVQLDFHTKITAQYAPSGEKIVELFNYVGTDSSEYNLSKIKYFTSRDFGKSYYESSWDSLANQEFKDLDCAQILNSFFYIQICRGDECINSTPAQPVLEIDPNSSKIIGCYVHPNHSTAVEIVKSSDGKSYQKIRILTKSINNFWIEQSNLSGNWLDSNTVPVFSADNSTFAIYFKYNHELAPTPEGYYPGSVYLYSLNSQNYWQKQYSITVHPNEYSDWRDDIYINSNARISLNTSGNTLAIGLPSTSSMVPRLFDPATVHSGSVQIWQKDLSGNWAQEATLKATNAEAYDLFGSTLTLSADGNTLAVNAPWEMPQGGCTHNGCFTNDDVLHLRQNNSKQGAGYIFKRTDTSWQQAAYLAQQTKVNDGIPWSEHFFCMSFNQTSTQLKVGTCSNGNTNTSVTSQQDIYFIYQLNNGVWTLTE